MKKLSTLYAKGQTDLSFQEKHRIVCTIVLGVNTGMSLYLQPIHSSARPQRAFRICKYEGLISIIGEYILIVAPVQPLIASPLTFFKG